MAINRRASFSRRLHGCGGRFVDHRGIFVRLAQLVSGFKVGNTRRPEKPTDVQRSPCSDNPLPVSDLPAFGMLDMGLAGEEMCGIGMDTRLLVKCVERSIQRSADRR